MSEVADFLLARIADDEHRAHAKHDVVFDAGRFNDAACCGYPARVLAECEAKRRIVENALRHVGGQSGYGASHYAVQCLASIYADHPDYREEWKP